jgi:putative cell wall-binding protein
MRERKSMLGVTGAPRTGHRADMVLAAGLMLAMTAALVLGGAPTSSAQEELPRLAGPSRIDTAVAISQYAFPGGADRAFLARADVFADALAAGALTGGPVLLVPQCGSVPRSVADEIERLDPAEVLALGGGAAVCDDLLAAAARGRSRGRLAGTSRFTTAVEISREQFPDGATEVYIADAQDSPDAVAAGALTAGPILLVPGDGAVPSEVSAEIARLDPRRVIALGGTAVVSARVLQDAAAGRATGRLAGSNRFETAVGISGHEFPDGAVEVYLARGDVFADAVAAGSLTLGPVLLVPLADDLLAAVAAEIERLGPERVVGLGGAAAVRDSTLREANEVAQGSSGGAPPPPGGGDGPPAVLIDRTGFQADTHRVWRTSFSEPAAYASSPTATAHEVTAISDADQVHGAPNGRYIASVHAPTAATRGRIDIVDPASDQVVDSLEYDGGRVPRTVAWSPDGAALAFSTGRNRTQEDDPDGLRTTLHRIGGPTSVGTGDMLASQPRLEQAARRHAFSSNTRGVELVACDYEILAEGGGEFRNARLLVTDQAHDQVVFDRAENSNDQRACRSTQRVAADGTPTAVFRTPDSPDDDGPRLSVPGEEPRSLDWFTARAEDTGLEESYDWDTVGDLGGSTQWGRVCGELVIMRAALPGATEPPGYFVHSTVTGESALLTRLPVAHCPVPSPDGARVAYPTRGNFDGPLEVAELGTGDTHEVANVGRPVAWSADGTELVVRGNGTFVVAADGSGDAEVAAVDLLDGNSISGRASYCRAGHSGLILASTGSGGTALLDIAANEVLAEVDTALNRVCTIAEGRWVLAGSLLADLRTGTLTELPRQVANRPLSQYRWIGPQDVYVGWSQTSQPN